MAIQEDIEKNCPLAMEEGMFYEADEAKYFPFSIQILTELYRLVPYAIEE